MLTIFRIQNKDGRGPFMPGFSRRWIRPREDHEKLTCWLQEMGRVDLLKTDGYHIGCGCRTLAQLQRWFRPSEFAALRGYGFQCYEMDIDRILGESETQVVFERKIPLRLGARHVKLYRRVNIPQ